MPEKSKHTPGPWEASEGETYRRYDIEAVGGIIAQTEGDTETDEANANLIAAAPDMLKALKDSILLIRHWGSGEALSDARIWEKQESVCKAICAAIAKAEGEPTP